MLLRRGWVYRAGSHWTLKHRRWLLALSWEPGGEQTVFGDDLQAIEHLEERLRGLDAALQAQAERDPYREPVGWLRCLRGFDTLNAMTVVAELHDMVRFGSARKLMAYPMIQEQEATHSTP